MKPEELRAIRERLGYTQAAMAQALGVRALRHYQRMEAEPHKVEPGQWRRITERTAKLAYMLRKLAESRQR